MIIIIIKIINNNYNKILLILITVCHTYSFISYYVNIISKCFLSIRSIIFFNVSTPKSLHQLKTHSK